MGFRTVSWTKHEKIILSIIMSIMSITIIIILFPRE